MKFYLLSTDEDTLTGMRLAGIDGEKILDEYQFERAVKKVLDDSSIGVVLITDDISSTYSKQVLQLKKLGKILVTQIPSSAPQSKANDSITKYIQDAIGIKL